MSISSNSRRDMSYRKPVPVFVPSPPPSPRPISPAPAERTTQSFEAAMNKEMPPLPVGWRDAIHKATSKDKRVFDNVTPAIPATPETDLMSVSRASSVYGSFSGGEQNSPSMAYLSDTYSVSEYSVSDYGEEPPVASFTFSTPPPATPSPHSGRKRTLPTLEYRPPTPPLAVYSKKGRVLNEEPNGCQTAASDLSTIYSESPPFAPKSSYLDVPRAVPRVKQPIKEQSGRPEYVASTSYGTEAIQATSTAASTGISSSECNPDARETWLRETWYILPVFPNCGDPGELSEAGGVGKQECQYPEVSHQAKSHGFWGRIGLLGHLLRTKLKHLGAVPFPNCD